VADNIHFLTNNPADPADAYGCSGFPFKIATSAPSPEYYPIALARHDPDPTAPSCSKWSLRTRIWKPTTDGTAGSVSIPSVNMTDFTGRTRELEIRQGAGAGTVFQTLSGTGYDLNFEMFGDPLPKLWKDGTDYKPQINIAGSINDGMGNTLEFNSVESELSGPSTGSITGKIDTKDIPIYMIATGTASMTSFELNPSEFWPYDYQGDPIYDTATGAILPGMDPTL
jgi:hypothetical protein